MGSSATGRKNRFRMARLRRRDGFTASGLLIVELRSPARKREAQRDHILRSQSVPTPVPQTSLQVAVAPGCISFGEIAEMWRKDYVENPKIRLAEPTRKKYLTRLNFHILPRWKQVAVAQMRSKEILDWLHSECTSWYMMVDLRNILSALFSKAQEWEVLPDGFANPTRRVKLGRRWGGATGTDTQRRRHNPSSRAAL
jgi:hypothetical protein